MSFSLIGSHRMKELSVNVVDYEVGFYDWLTMYLKIHL